MYSHILLVVMLALSAHQAEAGAAAGAEIAKTVVDSANTLMDVVGKVDQLLIKPFVEQVDAEIKKINTDIDGITAEEKQKVVDTMKKMALAKNNIQRVRAVLTVLADETISRSTSLKTILKKTLDMTTVSKQKFGLKLLVQRQKQVLERSRTLLAEALREYKKVNDEIAVVGVELDFFKKAVIRLSDARSAEHKKGVEAVRTKAYAGALAGLAGGPIGVAISYSVAAAVVETKIKEWKAKLDSMKTLCTQAVANVDKVIKEVAAAKDGLQQEEMIVRTWESKVQQAVTDFEDPAFYIEMINWDDSMKHEQIAKMDGLIAICQKFKDHVAKTPL